MLGEFGDSYTEYPAGKEEFIFWSDEVCRMNKKAVIVEAKYISNQEDVKNFRNQIEDAEKQVSKYLNSEEWAAD